MTGALRRRHPGIRATAINWGAWAGGMVTPELAAMFAGRGVTLIPVDVGVRYLVDELAAAATNTAVVIVGPDMPLSPRPADRAARAETTIERDLRPLARSTVLADHALDRIPVLPTTAAVGMLAVIGERVLGKPVRRVTDVSVLKGVVFDRDAPSRLELAFSALSGERAGVLIGDDRGRARYRAEVVGAAPVADGPVDSASWTESDSSSWQPATVYRDGTLFHGPSLQGITRWTRTATGGVLLASRRPAGRLAPDGYGTPLFDPVAADVLLQAALAAARVDLGLACLPSAIGSVDIFAPLPPEFTVLVDGLDPEAAVTRVSATAAGADGAVLLRMRDVQLTCSPSLADKFAVATAEDFSIDRCGG